MTFQKFNEFLNEATLVYTDKYSDLTLTVLQTQAQNKLLHWGTLSFAQHKAFDDFKGEFDGLSDNLIESIMGKYGRPIVGASTIEVMDYNMIDTVAYFDSLYEYFTDCIGQFQPKENNEEIVNILAEIIALVDKTKYLLTLNEEELMEALKLNESATELTKMKYKVQAESPYNDGWTQDFYRKALEELSQNSKNGTEKK